MILIQKYSGEKSTKTDTETIVIVVVVRLIVVAIGNATVVIVVVPRPAPQKRELLAKANLILEKLRFFLRLGYDLGYFSSIQRNDYVQKVDEIGRMIGGWLKALK